jgi:O-antigen/teichoic acid export membrane protein
MRATAGFCVFRYLDMNKPDSNARKLVKHSTIYAIGNVSRQLIGFVMLPVYTRFLTPADYGVIGLLTFAMSLLEGMFGARLAVAMPKFYFEQPEQRDRNAVISTALLVAGGASLLIALVLTFTRGWSSELLFGTGSYSLVLGIFCFTLLTGALESQSLVYLQIQSRPQLYVAINLAKLVVQFTFNIIFVVYYKWGVMGIAISSISSSGIFAVGLTIYSFVHTGVRFSTRLAREMIIFSWPLWIAGIASLYIASSGRYYIRIFSSLQDVGFYELGAKFSAILTLLVAQPFNRFWEIERFNHYKKSNNAEIFRGVFQLYATILVLTALGISLFAEPVVRIMAGPQFHDAYRAVPFLTLSALVHTLTDYCNFSFLVTSKTSRITKNFFAAALAVTVLYLLLTPSLGFVGAAIALLVAETAQFIYMQRTAKRLFDMQIHLRWLAVLLAIAAVAYVVGGVLLRQQDLIADVGVRSMVYVIFAALLLAYVLRSLGSTSLLRSAAEPLLGRFPVLRLLLR